MGLQSLLKIRVKTSKLFALRASPYKGSEPRADLDEFIFSIRVYGYGTFRQRLSLLFCQLFFDGAFRRFSTKSIANHDSVRWIVGTRLMYPGGFGSLVKYPALNLVLHYSGGCCCCVFVHKLQGEVTAAHVDTCTVY
jgi:hypothetical protein